VVVEALAWASTPAARRCRRERASSRSRTWWSTTEEDSARSRSITLEVADGELVAVLGSNGAARPR
jgi:ABC-type polysaccharide/polyol phosphate transport system ATPase subunit